MSLWWILLALVPMLPYERQPLSTYVDRARAYLLGLGWNSAIVDIVVPFWLLAAWGVFAMMPYEANLEIGSEGAASMFLYSLTCVAAFVIGFLQIVRYAMQYERS